MDIENQPVIMQPKRRFNIKFIKPNLANLTKKQKTALLLSRISQIRIRNTNM